MPALAGANLIYGLGMLELGITFDYSQLVMDNDMVKMIRKVVEGVDVNDASLAVDVIREVGATGEFITHEHTFKHMKEEQSQPDIIDRRMRDAWEERGSKDFTQRAFERAVDILENHKPDPLPEGVPEKIREIIEETEKEYGLKK